MPYIEKETVKEIREKLKRELPGLKLSVRRENYSSVDIAVMAAADPAWKEYDGVHKQVNHFYVEDNYADNPTVRDALMKIVKIARKKQRELVYDGDYGNVPNYYVHVNIGKWDKPFELKN